MTSTGPRGAGGTGRAIPVRSTGGSTISARNRNRRRAAASSAEPRRAAIEARQRNAGQYPAELPRPRTLAGREHLAPAVPPVAPARAVSAMPLQAVLDDASFDGLEEGDSYAGKRRRAHDRGFLATAVIRCCLYLGPLSAALVAEPALSRVGWPVPVAVLLLGWGAAQALTSMGVTVARRTGPAAAARLVGTGFLAVIGLWCALVWIAPAALLGPDRALAASVGVFGLLALGSVTAALVSRSEGAVAAWYVPCWLLALLATAPDLGITWAAAVPAGTLLPAAIVAVAVRALRPAVLLSRTARRRLTGTDRRRAMSYLIVGAAQAICVSMLWHAGPAVCTLPVLLAVPLLEAIIGWHTERVDAGLDSAQSNAELDRHIRNITVITLAGLLPPFALGGGLALAAHQLPAARGTLLALAAGTLLGGVFAVTFLLAARSRTGIAATLAAVPPLAAAVIVLFPPPTGPMPAAVAVLGAAHLAGLFLVALTAADLRRTP
ncbi:hypothetical protein [Actinoplanes sp. DH11]|uniref:hypothetical protein n=1 Tax=Actinoplanes sp. DH11 TaxID=2857011 RepID=UPI001E329B55|nr:hypothetical protein [Actinoplanes sp. DH11]